MTVAAMAQLTGLIGGTPPPSLAAVLDTRLGQLTLLLGILLLILSAWMGIRKRLRARHDHVSPMDQVQRWNEHRGVQQDLESLMVEVEQLAKRLGAQLDAKSVRLERLIEQADERIARLERREADGQTNGHAAAGGASDGAAGQTAADPVAREAAALRERLYPRGKPPAEAQTPPQASEADRRLAASVAALADKGESAAQIAETLNEHVGKVELILAMRAAERTGRRS